MDDRSFESKTGKFGARTGKAGSARKAWDAPRVVSFALKDARKPDIGEDFSSQSEDKDSIGIS
jgi:hypothetical protein